jgi:hypothetical protein
LYSKQFISQQALNEPTLLQKSAYRSLQRYQKE